MQRSGVLLDVISFNAAISACEIVGQWHHVAPLLNELQESGTVALRGQLHRSLLSLKDVGAAARCGAVAQWDTKFWAPCLM
eukprot:12417711-Karenia_brevis.AAC.1